MMKIGTSGFRGIIGEEYTKDEVCKIVECTCKIIEKQNFVRKVVIGYDNRFMSEIFARWASEVFVSHNIHVIMCKKSVSSPLLSFAGNYEKVDLSLMITASHNPYMYNGIKIFSSHGQDLELYIEELYDKYLPKIKNYKVLDFDEGEKRGLIEYKDYSNEFVQNMLKLLKFKIDKNLKTLFDCMNGSSVSVITSLKKALKLNVEILNTNRDALFDLKGPIPTEENLTKFKKYAIEQKVDFAFATDGDGDRVAVYDEKGNYLSGNELASLIYYFAIKEKGLKGGFVKNYSFSTLIDKICDKYNKDLFETSIGFKYISQKMIDTNSLVGAENSGIEVKGNVYTKDGLVVYLLLLEILSFYKKPLSKIVEEMKSDVGYTLKYREYSFNVKNKSKIIRTLQKEIPEFKKEVVKVGHLDGFKYYFKDGTWALVRFSGTEELLRLVCEQKTKKEVDELIAFLKDYADKIE